MSLTYRSAWRTDVGRARERNEDACFAGGHVFAVADGLGGHQAGEVASSLALEPVAALDQLEPRKAADEVARAVRKGNRAVFDRSQRESELQGMGTTLTAVAVHDGTAHIAHVGDSRCYLIRGSVITRLSNDHTLVARMVAEGRITQEQAESHPQRSILTRALGAERDVDVDEMQVDLLPDDRLLLCSDGLTSVLNDEEIRTLACGDEDLDEACQALVDEANARGGPDNITIVLIEVGGTAPARRAAALPGARRERDLGRRRSGHGTRARVLVWSLVLLALVLGGILGVRAWASRSYYVGLTESEQVAIFRGLPVEVAGLSLSEVEEPTEMQLEDVADWLHPQLREGIRADSLRGAREVVEQQIRPHASTTPEPPVSVPLPTPSAEGSPS